MIRSPDRTWREGPSLAVRADDPSTVRIADGPAIAGTYSNGNLGWTSESGQYGPGTLREDFAWFGFLLGVTDGEGLFTSDEP